MKYSEHFKSHFSNKAFVRSLSVTILLFSGALIMNYFASLYASQEVSGSVTDIILSNTRTYDVDGIFVYGTFAMVAFIAFLVTRNLYTLPFTGQAIALFIIIRSFFITLTHIGPFPTELVIQSDVLSRLSFGGDLFFSGHTGLPFLLALIFWEVPHLRYTFIALSGAFGVIVLLGHIHYTIDVVSAFFITYGIFQISKLFFKKDNELLMRGLHSEGLD